MKIKECMACKLASDLVVDFLTDVIPYTIVYESLGDATDGWFDDAKTDPEAKFSTDFLLHMTQEHRGEIESELCYNVGVKLSQIIQEVL